MTARYDAVVLAGGGARRLGGADKPGLVVAGRPMVTRVADAVEDAERLILAGAARDDLPHAIVVREDPPGAGPVPALRVALAEVRAPYVLVLAADLPLLRPADVNRLLDALPPSASAGGGRSVNAMPMDGVPGAVLVDDDGRPQWLVGAWRTAALREALEAYPGRSLRGVMEPLAPRLVRSRGRAWYDCDTEADVAEAARIIEEQSH